MKIKWFENVKTYDELKKAYRDLMKKYHPDLNPDKQEECTEIAKEINKEFEYLFEKLPNQRKNKDGEYYETKKEFETPSEFMNIINKLIKYPNLKIDIIGSWLWVSGETKPLKELLKELNFKWHSVRLSWYLKFTKTKSTLSTLSFDELKDIYGGDTMYTKSENNANILKLSLTASH